MLFRICALDLSCLLFINGRQMNTNKVIITVVAIIIAVTLVMGSDSDEFHVIDAVPASFRGAYVKVFEEQPGDLWPYDDTHGVEFFWLDANRIGIRKWEGDCEYFEVQRIHQLANDELIVFYGQPDERHVAEHRRQFAPRSTGLLDVSQIFSPGGNDVPQRIGKFQLVEHYAGILKPPVVEQP
jgi:hypothetical protein